MWRPLIYPFMASSALFLPVVAALGLLTSGSFAQPGEFPWPANYATSDTFRHMACGRVMANYPAQVIAISRGGRLFLAPDPTSIFALKDVTPPGTSVHGLANLEEAVPGVERLATVQLPDGLRVLRDDPSDLGLEMVAASNNLSAWTTIRRIVARRQVANAMTHVVVGCADTSDPRRVRIAAYDGAVLTETAVVLAGQAIRDVALVDQNGDNQLEVAVLAGDGLWLLSTSGSVLAHHPISFEAGRICASPSESVMGAVKVGGVWSLAERLPNGQLQVHGTLSLSANVTGVTMGLLPSTSGTDAYPDVLISTTQSFRTIIFGQASGYDVAQPVTVDDVLSLPPIPAPNPVPALIKDVNGDGVQDIVLASSAADRLVITNLGFLPYSLNEFAVNHPEAQDAWISMWDGADGSSPDSVLSVKWDAPIAGQGTDMAVILWKFDPLSAEESNPVMTLASVLTYPLVNGSADTQIVLPNVTNDVWQGNEAFMIELRRVQISQGTISWVGPATNFMFAVNGLVSISPYQEENWDQTASRLAGESVTATSAPAGSYEVGWTQGPAPQPAQQGKNPGMGNRRIGVIINLKAKVVPIPEVPPAD